MSCHHKLNYHLSCRTDRISLPESLCPTHYDLKIKPHMNTFIFEGSVSIRLKVQEETSSISLNASELGIIKIEICSNGKIVHVVSFEMHRSEEVLQIKLEDKLVPGSEVLLKIDYIGSINNKMAGFYRSSYEDLNNGELKYMAVTQFEPTDARKAFPCWDEPSVKAKFTISLEIPSNLSGLSNMGEDSRLFSRCGNWVTIKFKESPIMSTYLIAWVIGELEYIEKYNEDDVLVRVYATPGCKKQGMFALDVACKTLTFFTKYFDEPYPLPKLDMVAIPDFSNGAMENWGLVTYFTAYILFDEAESSLKAKKEIAYTVAHELAHQWFGNLVTMEWWNDLWLNEGFATWVGWLAVDHLFAEWDIWSEFVTEDLQYALGLDSLTSSHPIEVPVKNAAEISQIFDAISYSKGASVIRMLVKYLSESTFQSGMRSYLKKHRFSNAKTSDLWNSLASASNKSIPEIMNSWIIKTGYPLLKISSEIESDKLNVTINQNRFLSCGKVSIEDDQTIWSVPLRLKHDKNDKYEEHLMIKRESCILIPGDVKYYKFNFEQTGFYRVQYPMEWLRRLCEAVERGSFGISDRVGIISDIFALNVAGMIGLPHVFEMLKYYKDETSHIVWNEITIRLNGIISVWWEADEETLKKLKLLILSIYSKQLYKFNFETEKGEDENTILLRPLIIGMAGKCGHEQVLNEAAIRFQKFFSGISSAIDPNLRSVVFNLISETGGQPEFEKLFEIYKRSSISDQKLLALDALGFSKDLNVVKKALQLTLNNLDVKPQDYMNIFRSVGLNPRGRRIVWEFLACNWSYFYDRFSSGSFSLLCRIITYSTQNFTSLKDFENIQTFFADKNVESIDRTIHQSLEKIRTNVNWLEADSLLLSEWL